MPTGFQVAAVKDCLPEHLALELVCSGTGIAMCLGFSIFCLALNAVFGLIY